MARKIAGRSPLALRLSRSAIEQGLHSSFEQTLELEASHILACVGDGSYVEYVERRVKEMTER
jgi:enoyl-CoA hydratase/carnithine racemase